MHEIDFLPAEYRQKHARQQARPWQVVVIAAVAALMIVGTVAQRWRQHRLRRELAEITVVYDDALRLQTQLANLEKRLATARGNASLYTYLRHPWPRSQLLAALARPLPEPITLQQVQISREPPTGGPPAVAPPVDRKAEEERLKRLSPAERDLAALSERLDAMQTVVVLSGAATESAALHKYIGALDATDIFNEADLDSFNSIDGKQEDGAFQFRAVLAVQPGYGQIGGPTAPERKELAHHFRP
jgi:hypothetical protein